MPASASGYDRQTLDQAFANAAGLFRALARASTSGRYEEGDGFLLVHTGSPVAFFNPAFITRLPSELPPLLRRIDAFYGALGGGSVVYAKHGDAPQLERHLEAIGYERGDDERGLLRAVRTEPGGVAQHAIDFVAVRDAAALATFQQISARSFDVPAGWLGDLEADRLNGIPGLTLYLGLSDNEPVCTGALFVTGSLAGVHIIGTVAEHRRRGLGEAMTRHVIDVGATAGCLTCALTSSVMSHGMYQRLGFQHVADYAVWERAGKRD